MYLCEVCGAKTSAVANVKVRLSPLVKYEESDTTEFRYEKRYKSFCKPCLEQYVEQLANKLNRAQAALAHLPPEPNPPAVAEADQPVVVEKAK